VRPPFKLLSLPRSKKSGPPERMVDNAAALRFPLAPHQRLVVADFIVIAL
jgi:hypothetical protein